MQSGHRKAFLVIQIPFSLLGYLIRQLTVSFACSSDKEGRKLNSQDVTERLLKRDHQGSLLCNDKTQYSV